MEGHKAPRARGGKEERDELTCSTTCFRMRHLRVCAKNNSIVGPTVSGRLRKKSECSGAGNKKSDYSLAEVSRRGLPRGNLYAGTLASVEQKHEENGIPLA